MGQIVITSDSTCDLSDELVKKLGVDVLPLYVVLGDKPLKDRLQANPDMIYDYVANNRMLPKTSAASVDDYITAFKNHVDAGYEVIHFNISSEMSSTHQNAVLAASEVGNVYVVDSRNLSTGTALLIMDAADMIAQGKSAKEIAQAIAARTGLVRASFVVDSLEYLRMGGRCSAVAVLGANMLKLKPCIQVKDGVMGVGSKYRGPYDKVILKYVEDMLTKTPNINTRRAFVTHTKCEDSVVKAVCDKVRSLVKFDEFYETTAGCVITSHCGPNTLGVLFEVNE